MLLHRVSCYSGNSVSENEIWKDRIRAENNARNNVDRWQYIYAEYQQLYARGKNKNVTRSSLKKSLDFNRNPEKPNVRKKGFPETTAMEVGWRHGRNNKLEMFGVNIRGLKTKRDIYKTFNWPHN